MRDLSVSFPNTDTGLSAMSAGQVDLRYQSIGEQIQLVLP